MNFASVEKIVDALLYEGYLLYPYRPSALKNRYRWMFGVLLPPAYFNATGAGDTCWNETQCLLRGSRSSTLEGRLRFLHLGGDEEHAAEPREVFFKEELEQLLGSKQERYCAFPSPNGQLEVQVQHWLVPLGSDVFRLTVRVENVTPDQPRNRDEALLHALLSTHLLLGIEPGEFISLQDPPKELRPAAEGCCNVGTWPVLVGDKDRRNLMLSAPIILGDFPQVAPESPTDLFDGTEIDELLALRILTLTDAEKAAMRAGDERARALLARIEDLDPKQAARLHGAVRNWQRVVPVPGAPLRPGERVRLRPRGRADVFDVVLTGKTATIQSIEQDYEGRVYLSVVVDEDPGRDLGCAGKPGHRFHFRPEEVERLGDEAEGS